MLRIDALVMSLIKRICLLSFVAIYYLLFQLSRKQTKENGLECFKHVFDKRKHAETENFLFIGLNKVLWGLD